MDRPSTALLESAYNALFHSSLDKLIDSAVCGRLFHGNQNEEGVAGRSMAWKLFLTDQPPLTASLNPHPVPPLDSLRSSRERYASLLKEKMRVPDGNYQSGFQVLGNSTPTLAPRKPDDWNLNNPLSLDSSNPWHAYFSAVELWNIIRQDVERTFPEIPYFRSSTVQIEMTQILFLHSTERDNVGYRQGMHELLACVYRAVDFDSVESNHSQASPQLQELCDRTHVAADTHALFGAVMRRMEIWYEWRAPIPDPLSPTAPQIPHFSANGEAIQPQVNVLANGQLDLKSYVAPIVPVCVSLRDEKLRTVDPHLWAKLRDGGVEAQMYGIRWLRLLFTREFSLAESMVLWDGLFASAANDSISPSDSSHSQQGFELALWISVAMLIRIRNGLIPGDYTTQLTHLLRYPTPFSLVDSASASSITIPELLLSQAQLLKASPTPGTGATLVMQNRNQLGIPVEVPDPPLRQRRGSASAATAPPTVSQGRTSHHERPRLQDMITNRLMDANESLGIQRGLLNTISELRKNLPDLSQTLIRTPSWNGSAISLVDERPDELSIARSPPLATSDIDERPPWEPRPRSEVEREISELRALLKNLGDAVGWAVDVLLLDEDQAKDTQGGEKALQKKKAEAIECMAYVRDVLSSGGKGEIDEERLVSEEEYMRRRIKEAEKTNMALAKTPSPPPKPVLPPPPTALPESTPQGLNKPRSARESATPISSLTRTPVVHPHPGHPSSNPPFSSFSSHAGQISQVKPKPSTTVISDIKKIIPPWEHTPSNFSDNSYASGSLPRRPPPSSTASPRKPPDHSTRVFTATTNSPSSESPKADPLGVLQAR